MFHVSFDFKNMLLSESCTIVEYMLYSFQTVLLTQLFTTNVSDALPTMNQ